MKFKVNFEVVLDVNSDDYDDGLLLAKAEAEGMSRVLMANTNYPKFKIKGVHADLSEQLAELKKNTDDMFEAIASIVRPPTTTKL